MPLQNLWLILFAKTPTDICFSDRLLVVRLNKFFSLRCSPSKSSHTFDTDAKIARQILITLLARMELHHTQIVTAMLRLKMGFRLSRMHIPTYGSAHIVRQIPRYIRNSSPLYDIWNSSAVIQWFTWISFCTEQKSRKSAVPFCLPHRKDFGYCFLQPEGKIWVDVRIVRLSVQIC